MDSWFHFRFRRFGVWLCLGFLVTLLTACQNWTNRSPQPQSPPPAVLRIFWNQGFYAEEDQALQKAIADWERQSHIKVELSLFSSDDILNQAVIALENNDPPDILFAHRADYTLQPRWALEGKLADVSDVVRSVEPQYSPTALNAAHLYNKTTQQRSYYGVPIELQTIHVHYWRDLLEQVNLKDTDIPNDWNGFWQFWQRSQQRIRQQGEPVYGLGLPLSPKASDTFFLFEQLLEANNIQLLDDQGKLRLTDPAVSQGLIAVLDWLTGIYRSGYVPKAALNWVDSDNNVTFLNHSALMTVNSSLSIPASQRADPQVYRQQLVTRPFPSKPDGSPMSYLVSVKQAVIFANSRNPQAAKDFLTYLIQPDRLNTYIKESLGRWFPVMPDSLQDTFWQNTQDPHISAGIRQFQQHSTRPFYHVLNPAYSQVQAENVWGNTLHRILINRLSPEAAVNEAIMRIDQIFAEWER
ncbi:ABC transporter substrate-binding protein [Leptolyngbya ohadii]|uniref:ABC transporter substrate-binding protein n=1 Tax=Leptolyngbya ohadii TaxID=1962290 RepID=UPI0019D4455E|nr:ABC transporter substrate-binding protein [Leptolyngbya ohadii]